MEISATRMRIPPLSRRGSEPLPKITFDGNENKLKHLEDVAESEIQSVTSDEEEVTSLPEVVYGMMPRMAWMYR